jgi:hypothetical protein
MSASIIESIKLMTMRSLFLMAAIMTEAASAQQGSGVGYPTVAAALEALKTKSDVSISVQGGWTIADDKAAHAIWSFAPAGHPAYPAVVRRALVQKDGFINMDMTALCQAAKEPCDKLMEEFKALNARMSAELSATSKPSDTKWSASSTQIERVKNQSRAYFSAKDGARYQEAYALLGTSLQQQTPFSRWNFLAQHFNATAGQVSQRDIKKITWYKDPPQAAPGIYAAVDFSSQFANVNVHCGYLVWVEQNDGSFRLIREEQNTIDKDTESKLKPGELESLLAQFKCK